VQDSVRFVSPKKIAIDITVDEGQRFWFRDIHFTGNTKYPEDSLLKILGIQPGDLYNKKRAGEPAVHEPERADISSLYMDGATSASTRAGRVVEGDSIDLEVRIREGKQYRIRNVTIAGNTKTYDHVIRREIRTAPACSSTAAT
jgi:outer membrane protein insertion porin family